ncbi:MAG: type II toxin-antitoxin system prevent-host-death family antitoxin [Deltaproteobacteria bacterium]|nr:type II toxin-antitoxin system prevent-host-death family antitoxin [Deltaproteobacteria bacterium]
MEALDVFTVRDLRERTGDLIRDAEQGRLVLVTKHGKPALLALPFDEQLLEYGVHRALALKLFEEGHVGLAAAAKIAGTPPEEFLDLLAQAGIDAVRYPPDELAEEEHTAS